MSQRELNISHMQCWLFRLAQEKWNKTPKETAQLFKQHNIFSFIADCYDILHLSGYQTALNDIEAVISKKEAVI